MFLGHLVVIDVGVAIRRGDVRRFLWKARPNKLRVRVILRVGVVVICVKCERLGVSKA